MKLRFQAIDEKGRVVRGVLRAESADDARDLLLAENIFAKKLEPAEESEELTWAPKVRREARTSPNAAAAAPKAVRALFDTTAVLGFETDRRGRAGLTETGALVFEAAGHDPLVIPAAEVEAATLAGFPRRLLRVTLLSGRMYEFTAGVLFASSSARAVAAALRPPPEKASR